jgi:phage tail sheath protein FI
MPGVKVLTGATAGPSGPARAPSATYFAVGLAERGPTTKAERVSSLAEFERLYGTRPAYGYLYDDIRTFFEEGGGRAYVARTVGPAATTGALASPLLDKAGTPVATLQVTATGPGAWSSGLTVQVLAGSIDDTFTVRIRYLGELVESWANLRSPQEAVSRSAKSAWVRITDLASATVAPNNNPAVVAATALSAGADDRASVTAATHVAKLPLFARGLGDGAVAIPGAGDAAHAGLILHADAYNRTAILSTARGAVKADLLDLASSLDAERAGLFAPWVKIPDSFGGTRAIPPDGYIAGARARAHERTGPWRAAAGDVSRSTYIVEPDQTFERVDSDELNDGKVNIIIGMSGGVKNYGYRSLSNDTANFGFLTGSDVLNRVVTEAELQLEGFVFGVIDAKGHLLASIEGVLEGIVKPMADLNGLYPWIDEESGEQLDPGYKIDTQTVNTRLTAAANQVFASLSIRVSPVGEMVFLTVTKAGVLARL